MQIAYTTNDNEEHDSLEYGRQADFKFDCSICLSKPVDSRDKQGATPLLHAAQKNHRKCMIKLVEEKSANVNDQMKPGGFTSLFICAQNKSLPALQYLLKHQADPNIAADDGVSPVGIAASKGNAECLSELIKHKADINQKNSNNQTPLDFAIAAGKVDCVNALIDNKATYNNDLILIQAVNSNQDKVLSALCDRGVGNIDAVDEDDFPLIHNAAQKGNVRCLKYLIGKKGVDKNMADPEGTTAAFIAAFSGKKDVLDYLIEVKADIDKKDEDGRSPLFVACQRGFLSCVKSLIEGNASIENSTVAGQTLIKVATESKNMDIVRYLYQYKEGKDVKKDFVDFAFTGKSKSTMSIKLIRPNEKHKIVDEADSDPEQKWKEVPAIEKIKKCQCCKCVIS